MLASPSLPALSAVLDQPRCADRGAGLDLKRLPAFVLQAEDRFACGPEEFMHINDLAGFDTFGNGGQGKRDDGRAFDDQRGIAAVLIFDSDPLEPEFLCQRIAKSDAQALQLQGFARFNPMVLEYRVEQPQLLVEDVVLVPGFRLEVIPNPSPFRGEIVGFRFAQRFCVLWHSMSSRRRGRAVDGRVRPDFSPCEADAPLIIAANTVLTLQIVFQRLRESGGGSVQRDVDTEDQDPHRVLRWRCVRLATLRGHRCLWRWSTECFR